MREICMLKRCGEIHYTEIAAHARGTRACSDVKTVATHTQDLSGYKGIVLIPLL